MHLPARVLHEARQLSPGAPFQSQVLFTNNIVTEALLTRPASPHSTHHVLFVVFWRPTRTTRITEAEIQRAFVSLRRLFYNRYPNPTPGVEDERAVIGRSHTNDFTIFCSLD